MENDIKIMQKSFTDSLIKYKEHFGKTFPVLGLKNASPEQIIEQIEEAINKNIAFTEIELMHKEKNKDLKKIQISYSEVIDKIKESMSDIGYNYNLLINEYNDIAELRKQGHLFTFKEHLSALILAQLYNERWGDNNIRENIDKVRLIFKDYDKEVLKQADKDEIFNSLYKINCTNPITRRILNGLNQNIETFERTEKDYGSIDNFITSKDINKIADCFYEGKYKLIQVGVLIAYDYLRRVGMDVCNPRYQLSRLLGNDRLGLIDKKKATRSQVLALVQKMSDETGISVLELNHLLWQFYIQRGGNICLPTPNCNYCKLRNYCNYNCNSDVEQ